MGYLKTMFYPEKKGIHALTRTQVRHNQVDPDTVGDWTDEPYLRWDTFRVLLEFFAPYGFADPMVQISFSKELPRYVFSSGNTRDDGPVFMIFAEARFIEAYATVDDTISFSKKFQYKETLRVADLLDVADYLHGWTEDEPLDTAAHQV